MSGLVACLDAMARHDFDVVIFGREANARAVADTSRLWLSGTRAFSPSCVVVRATGAVHVLANTDDAVPADFPVDRLFGITWNPETLLRRLVAIPGLTDARTAAADGMTPAMHALLTRAMPSVRFVSVHPLLTDLWRRSDPERSAGVSAAAQVACDAFAAMVEILEPGVHSRALLSICAQASAAYGVTTPAFEAVSAPLEPGASTWIAPDRALAEGEVVVLRAGVLAGGWEACLARTFTIADPPHDLAPPTGWDAVVAECLPNTSAERLRDRGAIVYGVGRGVEPWDNAFVLGPGTVLALELRDARCVRQDVLHITESGPEILTS
jgi:Xaa-Pro aminopeptidase